MIKLLKRIEIKAPQIILRAIAVTLLVGGIGSLTACTRSEEPSLGRPLRDSAPTQVSTSINPFRAHAPVTYASKRHGHRGYKKFHGKKSHAKHVRGKKHAKKKFKSRRHYAKHSRHHSKRRRHA